MKPVIPDTIVSLKPPIIVNGQEEFEVKATLDSNFLTHLTHVCEG